MADPAEYGQSARDAIAMAWSGQPYGPGNENSVDTVLDALRALPVEVRMEAMGMVPLVVSLGSQEGQMEELITTWRESNG